MRTPAWTVTFGLLLCGCATSLPGPGPSAPPAPVAAEDSRSLDIDVLLARMECGTLREKERLVVKILRGPNWRPKYGCGDDDFFPPYAWKGSILAADDEGGVYLLSLGSKDGVKVGEHLVVSRGTEVLAILVIDKVLEDKASAVVAMMDGKPLRMAGIRTGDRIGSGL